MRCGRSPAAGPPDLLLLNGFGGFTIVREIADYIEDSPFWGFWRD